MIKKTTTKEIRINHELIKKIPKNIEDNIIEDENTLGNSNYTKEEIKSLQYKSRLRKKILGNYVIDDIEFLKIYIYHVLHRNVNVIYFLKLLTILKIKLNNSY